MNCTGYPDWFDEITNDECVNCPHDNDCWNAGRCLMEEL